MMIPIKIQCACGQRYAFDVEPDVRLLPGVAVCPGCGADGSAAANAMLARSPAIPASPAPVAPAPATPTSAVLAPAPPAPASEAPADELRLRVAARTAPAEPADSASSIPSNPLLGSPSRLGQVDPTQAEHEARAKIMWGDPPKEVIRYLVMQGFKHEEASGLVNAMTQERVAATRSNGIRKTIVGVGLICVPIVAFFIFMAIGYLPIKIFAVTILVGLYGGWTGLSGILLIAAPKMDRGDVADQ